MKQQLRAISFAAAALLASAGALADSYPTRPITLVVGFPAGGGADTVARIVSDKMAKLLGQPVIIDNKPGAGTTIASDQVARAAPDGYTLLLGSANLYGSDKLLYKAVKYDGATRSVPLPVGESMPSLKFGWCRTGLLWLQGGFGRWRQFGPRLSAYTGWSAAV